MSDPHYLSKAPAGRGGPASSPGRTRGGRRTRTPLRRTRLTDPGPCHSGHRSTALPCQRPRRGSSRSTGRSPAAPAGANTGGGCSSPVRLDRLKRHHACRWGGRRKTGPQRRQRPRPRLYDRAILAAVWFLAVIVPSLALTVRRLHDSNFSGWMYLIVLIPFIGGIILLVFTLLESKPEGQRFDVPA